MFTVNLKYAIAVNLARSLPWACLKTSGIYLNKAASKRYSKSVAPSPEPYTTISLDGTTNENCQYKVTGNPVENELVREGKLGGVFLDTNILGCLVERETQTQWVNNLLANATRLATCESAVVEYLAGPVVVLDLNYKVVIDRLTKKGVTILPGACASSDSPAFMCQVLKQSYQRLHAAAMKSQNLEVRAHKLRGSGNMWGHSLKKTLHDLMLASEAHRQGLAFLSHDANFGRHFGITLTEMGITTYLIPESWTMEELESQARSFKGEK
ncbi:hypothetical protein TWF594_009112 [Orbilia oligospora]|nr:hypothetical protein TWF103_005175 [Orbilia oligospora]KAF3112307.1 hypothetical protein TWF706_010894 [Orbilia oligospora]KAF3150468.1 hypothetical protein TWF594_009112 [Orbilia oligospora]